MRNGTDIFMWLGTVVIMVILFIGLTLMLGQIEDKIQQATIAGVTVPAVACQEDEVISWVRPDKLGCVHYEEVK